MAADAHLSKDQFSQMHTAAKEPGSGFTHNVATNSPATTGWAVAQHGHEQVVTPGSTATPKTYKNYAKGHAGAIAQVGHVGGWHQPGTAEEPSSLYLDSTRVTPNNYSGGVHALAGGYANKQLSVYNMDREQTLTMHPGETKELRDARNKGGISPALAHQAAAEHTTHDDQQEDNRTAMDALEAQRGASEHGPSDRISEMPTEKLAGLFRDRR